MICFKAFIYIYIYESVRKETCRGDLNQPVLNTEAKGFTHAYGIDHLEHFL